MEYTVLARKWRPKTFEHIAGQEHITGILKNAIKKGRVAHAYIFSGPRGVGKTSTARVLAKALNCKKGPSDTPCNKCSNCIEIDEGSNMDVIEIDGASNRGIDNIRELRENVKFVPVNSPYKIYIIDEVHMLSKEAFNALLKTLEEPPAHIKFIFATTEPHKIPDTILSRCQHFKFSLIPVEVIKERLVEILEEEGISFEERAVNLIAKSGQGSMRDAQSILDKVITYCDEIITYKSAMDIIGIIDDEMLFKIAASIAEKSPEKAYLLVKEIMKENKDAYKTVQDIVDYFERLLSEKLSGKYSDDRVKKLAEKFEIPEIIGILETFTELESTIKTSSSPYIFLEMAILKLAYSGSVVPVEQILKELHGIKKYIYTSSPSSSAKKEVIRKETFAREEKKEASENNSEKKTKEIKPLLEQVKSRWKNFLNLLEKKNKHLLRVHLQEGEVKEIFENTLTLEFDESSMFHMDVLKEPKNLNFIEEELSLYFGTPLKIKFNSVSRLEDRQDKERAFKSNSYDPREKIKKFIEENEIVKEVISKFEGRVVGFKKVEDNL